MTCDDYRKLISAYRDDELTTSEHTRLTEHLKSCAECRDYADEMGVIGDALRHVPSAVCPPHVETAILTKIREVASSDVKRGRFWEGHYRIPRGLVWVAAAAFIALLVEVTVHPFQNRSDDRSPSIPSESTPYVQKIVFSEYDVVYSTSVTKTHNNN
jgi:anti-sigma factor RsiW